MIYKPVTCVWEVTMGCNMRCKHCGSSCEKSLPGELSTEEGYKFIDMCADMGLKWITLSGGEPLTRKDIPLLVKRIREKGIDANIITNGWNVTDDLAKKLKEAGVSVVAISIDGTEEIHDSIRKKGSFARSKNAFEILGKNGIQTGCITTITNKNLYCLNELKKQLIDMGVASWQVQIGLPMGNLAKNNDWVITPDKINYIIDFCYNVFLEDKIKIFPADCIGYYNKKLTEIINHTFNLNNDFIWDGCNAGKHGFGILHNGDILGCTSIRNKSFIEGNIKEKSLKEIWESKDLFKWNRQMTRSKLTGDCHTCKYADICLGGCANTRLSMNGSIYSENLYCSHNFLMKKFQEKLKTINDTNELKNHADKMLAKENYQEAALTLDRLLDIHPKDVEFMGLKAFCEYMCGNIDISEKLNNDILSIDPENYYAFQGLGNIFLKKGNINKSINYLEKANKLTNGKNQDVLNDLNAAYKIKNEYAKN